MNYLKRTNIPEEMIAIGRMITEDKKDLYTPLMMEKMTEGVEGHIPDASDEEKENMLYRAIYDYWVYGCNKTIDDNSNFCMYCGAKVIKVCCPNCGSDNFPKDAHFCPDCGYKLQLQQAL